MHASATQIPIKLQAWLQHIFPQHDYQITSLPFDAGFRRYYRLQQQSQSFIVMDASLAHENCPIFIKIADALRDYEVITPEIHAADSNQGFILLTDFGDRTYLKTLNQNNADALYRIALTSLSHLQHCKMSGYELPLFNSDFMWQEWAWHLDWVAQQYLQLSLPASLQASLNQAMQHLIAAIDAQPKVFMHRDYHSANLMVLAGNQVGVLDFQDAFVGPVTYDLASLLRDCYIDWPKTHVLSWLNFYKHDLLMKSIADKVSAEQLLQWFDYMSIQRHLKAMLTYARKKVRDHDPRYLQYIPRTMHYLLQTTNDYSALQPLHIYLSDYVTPALEKVSS